MLNNAIRQIPKATYVPLTVPLAAATIGRGRALVKFSFVRQLALQPGEVHAVRTSLKASVSASPLPGEKASFWKTLQAFEGSPMPSQLPAPSLFTKITPEVLMAFGKALESQRQQAVAKFAQPQPLSTSKTPSNAVSPDLLTISNAGLQNSLNTATVANKSFEANVSATPIGMLNLERLEMTPDGIERGELLATIPLAPMEQTSVVQKEWSVTSQEFTSIVTDSLDNYSETGVTENTELAQSTTSQTQHANQFNINASVSGSYGFVTASVATQFGTQDSNSLSATDSRKHAVTTTRKASSRVKQSHKVTISTTTVTGSSETTTRTLQNPSATNPMRIDYFSLMRKWHVGLYRYGLRLTYDIAIPEPGGTLREIFATLAGLQQQAGAPFSFPVQYSDITRNNFQALAAQYGAQVPAPPQETLIQQVGGPIQGLKGDGNGAWIFNQLNFTVPDGYSISDVTIDYRLSWMGHGRAFSVLGTPPDALDLGGNVAEQTVDLTQQYSNFMAGFTGPQVITYYVSLCGGGAAVFTITQTCTDSSMDQWVSSVWSALYNAAQTTYYAQQQAINAQIASLQNQINGVDTLTLRREENDEIMKGILRWLLGPSFEFMPPEVAKLFTGDVTHGVSFTGNDLPLNASQWSIMFQYEEMVKFINEAIEWENVLYFLYSYFWDVPTSWDFVRQIQHPDSTRQAFLRAGSARVVLTIRKGYETAWVNFVETGNFGQTLIPNHPYMTIAQEIQNYDNTNYPGIPPANPASAAGPPDEDSAAGAVCSVKLAPNANPVNIAVDSSSGFTIGSSVVIDSYPTVFDPSVPVIQETQTITDIPDATHITVAQLDNAHDGTVTPFPIIQPGEKGVLISEWYEYTPSSGTDIAVTSDLTTIA